MNYTLHRIRSEALGNERDVFIHVPASGRCRSLLVFLDAELYRDRVRAPHILDQVPDWGPGEEPAVVFVSCCNWDARWVECECHPPFAQFVADELMPWLARKFPGLGGVQNRVLIGLSYTGLAASWVGLERPGVFQRIVSQSGSYWWNDCWISRRYELAPNRHYPSFYLDVGTRETDENVTHKPGVVQFASQLSAVREFRDRLARSGIPVRYEEFEGGHDPMFWGSMLPGALNWATSP